MPDTPGKRQRREVKAKRRQAKDERRTLRTLRRDDPNAPEQLLDENGFPVYDQDGYPVFVERELDSERQPDGAEPVEGVAGDAATPDQTA
ncbi:MAG: hypothetical protein ACXWEG_04955 [Actinomycetota bacterium]